MVILGRRIGRKKPAESYIPHVRCQIKAIAHDLSTKEARIIPEFNCVDARLVTVIGRHVIAKIVVRGKDGKATFAQVTLGGSMKGSEGPFLKRLGPEVKKVKLVWVDRLFV